MTPTAHLDAATARLEGLSGFGRVVVQTALRVPGAPGRPSESLLDGDTIPARLLAEAQAALAEAHQPQLRIEHQTTPPVAPTRTWLALHRDIVASWGLRGTYQHDAIRDLLTFRGGILAAAAGSGKTIIAARVVEVILREAKAAGKRLRLLWMAQTIEQVAQARNALQLVPDDLWHPDQLACLCWQGVDIAHGTVMHNGERIPLGEIDILVGDECHASADAYYAIARQCTAAHWRIGMSATPVRSDGAEILLRAAWGRVRGQVSSAAVIDQGFLVPAAVRWISIGEEGALRPAVDDAAEEEIEAYRRKWTDKMPMDQLEKRVRGIRSRFARQIVVTQNEEHHEEVARIARECLAEGHQVLVLVHERQQGREIRDRIPDSALAVSGMTKADGGGRSRAEVMESARAGEIRCLVATSLADQGLDIPSLSCVVMAAGGTGGKDGYLIQQRVARAQRAHGEKAQGLVVDLFHASDIATARQSWTRHRAYRALGFEIEPLPEGMRPRKGAAA